MKRISTIMSVVLGSTFVLAIAPLKSTGAQGKPIVVYVQMGGDRGIASVLARTNGAEAAAKALGIELHEQYASWDTKKMIDQFKEAIAAKPDGLLAGNQHPQLGATHALGGRPPASRATPGSDLRGSNPGAAADRASRPAVMHRARKAESMTATVQPLKLSKPLAKRGPSIHDVLGGARRRRKEEHWSRPRRNRKHDRHSFEQTVSLPLLIGRPR